MSDHDHSHSIEVPRSVLIATAIILLSVIVAIGYFRGSGQEPTARVPESDQIADQRQLRFADGGGGTVSVFEVGAAEDDRLIQVIEPGEGGFIRGVLRSLARARRASGISEEHPFMLVQHGNGDLILEDPMTGQRIYLQAFGPASIEAFSALLVQEDLE